MIGYFWEFILNFLAKWTLTKEDRAELVKKSILDFYQFELGQEAPDRIEISDKFPTVSLLRKVKNSTTPFEFGLIHETGIMYYFPDDEFTTISSIARRLVNSFGEDEKISLICLDANGVVRVMRAISVRCFV